MRTGDSLRQSIVLKASQGGKCFLKAGECIAASRCERIAREMGHPGQVACTRLYEPTWQKKVRSVLPEWHPAGTDYASLQDADAAI